MTSGSIEGVRARTLYLTRLPAARARTLRACIRRVAACALLASPAGQAHAGAKANVKLTFNLDSMGADHLRASIRKATSGLCGGYLRRPARWLMPNVCESLIGYGVFSAIPYFMG
jgi:hypothetical protein